MIQGELTTELLEPFCCPEDFYSPSLLHRKIPQCCQLSNNKEATINAKSTKTHSPDLELAIATARFLYLHTLQAPHWNS